jgi:hypothetical protein
VVQIPAEQQQWRRGKIATAPCSSKTGGYRGQATAHVTIPEGATVVDVTGRFVRSLIDTHCT